MLMLPLVILAMEDDVDRAYMTRLYREYRALMLKTAWEFSRDMDTVDDIVSESCIALIRHLGQLKTMEKGAIRAYIVITVRNKAIDDLRRQKLRQKIFVSMDEDTVDSVAGPTAFERKLNLRQEMDAVKEAIAALPAAEQDVLRLKFFQHRTDKEIAGHMEISETQVRALIKRARRRLKRMLYGEGEKP
ncbi:MAG: sigma-70 family RNA polymerase sigma factor [Clostridia bacterium]|nr:sigma-70 family RNA polymerase sigma factor [Clostridia bacterium]